MIVEQNEVTNLRMVYGIRSKLWNGSSNQKVGMDALPESAMKRQLLIPNQN